MYCGTRALTDPHSPAAGQGAAIFFLETKVDSPKVIHSKELVKGRKLKSPDSELHSCSSSTTDGESSFRDGALRWRGESQESQPEARGTAVPAPGAQASFFGGQPLV